MHDYNILTYGWVIFGVMTAVFIYFSFLRRHPIGIGLMFGGHRGGTSHGNGIPIRHLVEGAFTYFDPMLIIFTAMLFMRILEDNGSLRALADFIIAAFGNKPALLVIVITLFIMFPAMLTGITTISVLTTGAIIAPTLIALGMPRVTTGTMIALISVMGMIASPINLLAMLIGQGVDMPYIGFDGPLAFIAFPLAFIAAFSLGYPHLRHANPQVLLAGGGEGNTAAVKWTLFMPLLIVFIMMVAVRLRPGTIPDIGVPLIFMIEPWQDYSAVKKSSQQALPIMPS